MGSADRNVDIRVGGIPAVVVSATGSRATFRVPTGVPVGETTVVATNPGGRSGSIGLDLNGHVTLSLDEDHRVQQTIGKTGGTLTASSNGRTYTLTIPPGALIEDEAVVLTPITGIAGLPFDALLGAVQFSPEGLMFGKPATLAVGVPATADTRGLVAFSAAGNGENLHLVPLGVQNTAITIPVLHFSVAGIGTTSLAAASATTCGSPTLECEYLRKLGLAFLQAKATVCGSDCATPADLDAHISEILDEYSKTEVSLFREWFTKVLNLLNTTGSAADAGLFTAIHEYVAWRASLQASTCPGAASCDLVTEFQADMNLGDDAAALDYVAALERAHAACNDRRVADLTADIETFSLLGRSGLDANRGEIENRYACQLVISGSLPASVNRGDTVPFTVTVGVRTGGPAGPVAPQPSTEMNIHIIGCGVIGPTGGSGSSLSGVTDATGSFATQIAIPKGCANGTTQVGVSVDNILDTAYALVALGRTVTFSTTIAPIAVTVTPSAAIIGPGGQVQFGATVTGTANQNVTWTSTGGSIDQTGLYTAGNVPGTYSVTAKSAEDLAAVGTASVTIVGVDFVVPSRYFGDFVLCSLLNPASCDPYNSAIAAFFYPLGSTAIHLKSASYCFSSVGTNVGSREYEIVVNGTTFTGVEVVPTNGSAQCDPRQPPSLKVSGSINQCTVSFSASNGDRFVGTRFDPACP